MSNPKGWPPKVYKIYIEAVEKLGDDYLLITGPGHIIWEDENFDCAYMALNLLEPQKDNYSQEEYQILETSFIKLLELSPDDL